MQCSLGHPKQPSLRADNVKPIRPMAGNGEDSLDGMIPSESGAEDEGRRALSGVRDVLNKHQSKNGGSRAPDRDFLAEYARKSKTRSGSDHIDDEVSVCCASAFSWRTAIHCIVIIFLPRIILTHPGTLRAWDKAIPQRIVKRESVVPSFAHLQLSELSEIFVKDTEVQKKVRIV